MAELRVEWPTPLVSVERIISYLSQNFPQNTKHSFRSWAVKRTNTHSPLWLTSSLILLPFLTFPKIFLPSNTMKLSLGQPNSHHLLMGGKTTPLRILGWCRFSFLTFCHLTKLKATNNTWYVYTCKNGIEWKSWNVRKAHTHTEERNTSAGYILYFCNSDEAITGVTGWIWKVVSEMALLLRIPI